MKRGETEGLRMGMGKDENSEKRRETQGFEGREDSE